MRAIELLAEGFEEIEALTPVDYLRRAGIETAIAGVGQTCNVSGGISGGHKIRIECDLSVTDYLYLNANSDLPDAIIIPGGLNGAKNIAKNPAAMRLINEMNENNRLVCAICAAPIVVLAQTGILKGRKFTCYPDMEKQLSEFVPDAGKISELMEGSELIKDKAAIQDGNLITARGPGAAEEFSLAIINALCGEEMVQKIKVQSCLR
ncbi:MAG: DJ-1 family glyoxalase III [Treponema sp.]